MKPKKKFWKEVLKAPKYILDVIDDGYKLPLMGNVKSSFSKNNASAFEHKEFVSETIRELLLDAKPKPSSRYTAIFKKICEDNWSCR